MAVMLNPAQQQQQMIGKINQIAPTFGVETVNVIRLYNAINHLTTDAPPESRLYTYFITELVNSIGTRQEIEAYGLKLGKMGHKVVKTIEKYSDSFCSHFFYRIFNAIKHIFGQSDWQKSQRNLEELIPVVQKVCNLLINPDTNYNYGTPIFTNLDAIIGQLTKGPNLTKPKELSKVFMQIVIDKYREFKNFSPTIQNAVIAMFPKQPAQT